MNRLITLIVAFALSQACLAEVVVLNGVYQGTDLYVKNPFAPDGVGFCVFEVQVNGQVTSDEINSSAFAIDLSLFDLKPGDPVEIVIRSKADCSPHVINPEAIQPKSTFEVSDIMVDSEQMLKWTTTGESGAIPFVIEQFKWNKWVKLGEVMGEGDTGPNDYVFKVRLNAGENSFRVKQIDIDGPRNSERVIMQSNIPEVKLLHDKIFDPIDFDRETQYEVFDEYGVLVAQGYGKTIDTSRLSKGRYYLNFGAQFGTVVTKK